jgi:hypothetical protein
MSNKQEMLYGLCMVAMALQLTAICTEHWSVKSASGLPSGDSADLAMGLWKLCGEASGKVMNISGDVDACAHLPLDGVKTFPKNSLYAARAFALVGVIMVFSALMCMMYMKGYKRCQLVSLLAGGAASIIASIVWAAELLKVKFDDSQQGTIKFSPGYSFYLNLAGGLVALMAAVYYYYGK